MSDDVNQVSNLGDKRKSSLSLEVVSSNKCFLCLEAKSKGVSNNDDPRNRIQPRSFQVLIHYLTGADPTFDKISKSECDKSGLPFFGSGSGVSSMCQSCHVILKELERTHRELVNVQRKLQELAEAARKRILKAYQEKRASLDFDFDGSLHLKMVEAQKERRLLFPAKCPPPSPPSASPAPPFTRDFIYVQREAPPLQPIVKIEEDNATFDDGDPTQDDKFQTETMEETENDPDFEPEWMGGGTGEASDDNTSDSNGKQTTHYALRSSPRKRKAPNAESDEDEAVSTCTSTNSQPPKRYPCRHCNKSWNWNAKSKWKLHMQQNHPDDPEFVAAYIKHTKQTCDLCGEKEVPFTQIVKHLKSHFRDGPNAGEGFITKCPSPKCGLVFSSWAKMEKHVRTVSCRKFRVSLTKTCEHRLASGSKFETNRPEAFRRHLDAHEEELGLQGAAKQYSCPLPNCSERFILKQSINFVHMATHEPVQPQAKEQPCKICEVDESIPDPVILPIGAEIAQHLKEKHGVGEPVTCKRCPFLFLDQEAAMWHQLEDHHKPGIIPCNICEHEMTFFRKDSFLQHYFREHGVGSQTEEVFICEHCSREFYSQKGLTDHLKRAHSVPAASSKKQQWKGKYTCTLCPDTKVFPVKTTFLTHKIQEHGAPPLECPICKATFVFAFGFDKHKREHAGRKLYTCKASGCGKTFKKNDLLQDNFMKKHNPAALPSREKNHACKECGKRYYTGQQLKMHMESVHLGVRHFCDECGEGFTVIKSLQRHKLIHTGERPHNCHVCGQSFRHLDVMKKHLQGHEEKGESFRPTGPFKSIRKRVEKE